MLDPDDDEFSLQAVCGKACEREATARAEIEASAVAICDRGAPALLPQDARRFVVCEGPLRKQKRAVVLVHLEPRRGMVTDDASDDARNRSGILRNRSA